MTIGVWKYLDEYHTERADILRACETVFASGKLVLGDSVAAFEREFADYVGVPYCTGVDNGTNAITLALEAVGVRPGDEVITVSNTAAPTVVAITAAGAVPRFVDICDEYMLMDTTQLEDAITPRTTAIVVVHLYGQCVDMEPVRTIAAAHGLYVIEDCAQAHGSTHHGAVAGSMSDAAAFSFYPTKVLGAYGDGGGVVTRSPDIHHAVRTLRYYGMEETYYVVRSPGHNSRLDEVQAEILRTRLRRLSFYITRRQAIAARYEQELADTGLTLPRVAASNEHVYYLYVVRHADRERILGALKAHGVDLNVSYRWPIHTMTGFTHLGYRKGDLPVTERASEEIFSLPMYPSLSDDDQSHVIESLRQVLT